MIQIDHVTFSYGEETEHTGGVRDIELQIKRGEFAVLCGESGCGKTTITRLINGLIPHYYEGKMSGGVWVNGAEVSKQPLYDTAKIVGSVFQNPRSQFFNVDTTSEITFGCENLGQPAETIRARLERTVRDFRLEKLMDRNIFHLSGGEKQKVACAGVSIMEPEVLVLDEPSSNLDAASISDLRKTLAFWKGQGKTIVVSEHRLYYLRGLADRFIYMKGGKITREYTSEEFKRPVGASPDGNGATHFRPGTITTAANTAMHRDGTGAEAVPLCVSPRIVNPAHTGLYYSGRPHCRHHWQ